jgi:hypothetical protein
MKIKSEYSSLFEFFSDVIYIKLQTNFIIYVGILIIAMSINYTSGSVICASLTAIFGILADFCLTRSKSLQSSQQLIDGEPENGDFVNSMNYINPKLLKKVFRRLSGRYSIIGIIFNVLFYLFVLITLIYWISPTLLNNFFEKEFFKKLTDVFALIGLGISMVLVGIRNQITFKNQTIKNRKLGE